MRGSMITSPVGRNLVAHLPLVAFLFACVTVSAQRGGGPPAGGAKPHPAIGNREAIAEGEKLYRGVHRVSRQRRHRR